MKPSDLRHLQLVSRRQRDDLLEHPYTSPGSYPRFGLTTDGAAICKDCAHSERRSIGFTHGTDGWCLTDVLINWEDPELYCDHCGNRIESAYAEDLAS
jgi:hypothetical protein